MKISNGINFIVDYLNELNNQKKSDPANTEHFKKRF